MKSESWVLLGGAALALYFLSTQKRGGEIMPIIVGGEARKEILAAPSSFDGVSGLSGMLQQHLLAMQDMMSRAGKPKAPGEDSGFSMADFLSRIGVPDMPPISVPEIPKIPSIPKIPTPIIPTTKTWGEKANLFGQKLMSVPFQFGKGVLWDYPYSFGLAAGQATRGGMLAAGETLSGVGGTLGSGLSGIGAAIGSKFAKESREWKESSTSEKLKQAFLPYGAYKWIT